MHRSPTSSDAYNGHPKATYSATEPKQCVSSSKARPNQIRFRICIVHDQFNENEIKNIRKNNPGIKIIAHPECPPEVIKASDFAGSTSGMIKYVRDNQPKKVMMVTECSMSDNIQIENPNVQFIKPCNMCPHMKKITLPKILDCLENETGEIIMAQETIDKARLSVEKMVAIGR